MKNLKKRLSLICLLTFSALACAETQQNQINKMYHHTSQSKNGVHIELGSLVFYFKEEPDFKLLTSRSLANGWKEDVFLFPKTKVNHDIIKKVDAVLSGYTAKIESMPAHQDLKLVIQYDPQKVGTTHDTFDSIGMEKGLAIKFFNKELLEKIRNHPKPILQMAALQEVSKKKRLS